MPEIPVISRALKDDVPDGGVSSLILAFNAKGVSPLQKLLLIYIAERAGMGVCRTREFHMGQWAGCSARDARFALGHLLKLKMIVYGKRGGEEEGFYLRPEAFR